jgi:long-chain acyl-CoA synthetase
LIVDKIFHHAEFLPQKAAIIYGGHALSYKDLSKNIQRVAGELSLEQSIHFIQNIDPIQTLIELLAVNAKSAKGVVIPPLFDTSKLNDHDCTRESFIGILTSGTTGEEHLIWKSNDNWELAFKYQSEVFGISEKDNVFIIDALSYSANLNAALHILWAGGTLVIDSIRNARKWDETFSKNRVTSCFLVPSHCNLLIEQELPGSEITSIVTAGEKLNTNTAKNILAKFPKVNLTEYYGAAELGHITYHQNEDIVNFPFSVGVAFPDVKVTIIDDKVNVSSPYISAKYKKIGTVNDLGYFDGIRLILQGRTGRFFNRRAVNIYAQEIEEVALKLATIKQAVLVKTEKGDKLTLYFTAKESKGNAEIKLFEFLKANLPASKIPNFVREIDQIPHSNAGKVDFKALSKMSNEEIAMI